MEKIILIRYGEIHLKGRNRSFFEDLLVAHIKHLIKPYDAHLRHISGRYIVEGYKENKEEDIIEHLAKVAGIVSISPSFKVISTEKAIFEATKLLVANRIGTFKVETNRADKMFKLNSIELSRLIGGRLLEVNPNLIVDVHNPSFTVNIDIRENNETFVFTETINGIGGMPVGSAGNGLLLLSGGIDSPVAGYMMAKRGVKVSAIHFASFPYTSPQAKEKVISLAKLLTPYCGKIKLYVVSVTKIQEEIHAKCREEYMITLLRRFMFKIGEIVAGENGCSMLITGESLGQVASQTIESINVVEGVITHIPVLRPLIAFDKNETINIAKKINTYQTSIIPYEDCCTVFLPKNPLTKPRLEKVLFEESKLDCDALIKDAINSIETIEI